MTGIEPASPAWKFGRSAYTVDLRERRSWSSAGECPWPVTVANPWAPWHVARMWHAPGCARAAWSTPRDAVSACPALPRAGRRTGAWRRGVAGSGAASASVARLSCSARRRFSVRAASRSLSARSARVRSASRVSSKAVMRALVAVVKSSSARGGRRGCGDLGRRGLGVLGSGDSGGPGVAGTGGVLPGLLRACPGVGDLAGGFVSCGADVAVRIFAGLPDFRGGAVAGAAYLRFSGGA